jgi:ABC-2 type transport system permease protein
MKKLFAYFRVAIIDAVIYRAEGIIWMLNDIGPAVIALIFWSAAYQTHDSFAGYTYPQMLVYYLGIMFINNVINTQPQFYLSEEIRNGDFSKYLLKPINLTMFKFASNNSWRLVRLIFFLPLLLVIAKAFGLNFSDWQVSPVQILLVIISLVLAFAINFFLKLALGLTTIWFEEAGWLFFGFDILAGFLSGEYIPLGFLPNSLTAINNFLPFKYTLYFPLSLAMGKESSGYDLVMAIGWAVFAYIIYRFMLARGSRVYSAFGG